MMLQGEDFLHLDDEAPVLVRELVLEVFLERVD